MKQLSPSESLAPVDQRTNIEEQKWSMNQGKGHLQTQYYGKLLMMFSEKKII
jgi:hypothetical protein